jgi:hypothetical protein
MLVEDVFEAVTAPQFRNHIVLAKLERLAKSGCK